MWDLVSVVRLSQTRGGGRRGEGGIWAASLATRHKASVSWGETRVAEGEEWRLCRCGWRTESMRLMFFVCLTFLLGFVQLIGSKMRDTGSPKRFL